MSSPGVMDLSARPADPATSLFVLRSKAPFVPTSTEAVCLVNTQSLTSSLQDALPALLVDPRRATEGRAMAAGPRRYLFHVEAGITIADLGHVLAHRNPRLSLQAISGSPGATLAGAMATSTHGAEFTGHFSSTRSKRCTSSALAAFSGGSRAAIPSPTRRGSSFAATTLASVWIRVSDGCS
jgi:hypothetical protein